MSTSANPSACAKCGAVLAAGTRFCDRCGAAVAGEPVKAPTIEGGLPLVWMIAAALAAGVLGFAAYSQRERLMALWKPAEKVAPATPATHAPVSPADPAVEAAQDLADAMAGA